MMSSGNFNVYPNPAQGELNIEYLGEEGNLTNNTEFDDREKEKSIEYKIFRVEVLDHAEKVVGSGESKGGKVHLNISGLRPGSYYLHIFYDKEIIREQILVQ